MTFVFQVKDEGLAEDEEFTEEHTEDEDVFGTHPHRRLNSLSPGPLH